MNQQNWSGKWKELKGEIKNQWGRITDNELESAKGNFKAILGLIEQRYGDMKETASEELESLFKRFGDKANQVSEDAKTSLRDSPKH